MINLKHVIVGQGVCQVNRVVSRSSFLPARPNAHLRIRAEASTTSSSTGTTTDARTLFADLDTACDNLRRAPAAMRVEFSGPVLDSYEQLRTAGVAAKWGSAVSDALRRRNVFVGELRQVGIKNPDKIAVPSVRNDAAFLFSVVASTSILAVLAGQLPGDWGFFSSYLIGSITLVVLAVGSTAPGLLAVVIDKFSQIFPDYKERIIERTLTDEEIDNLALVAVAGIAAEGREYDEVMGQTADLTDLQRLLLRSRTRLSDSQQQNVTRWAVWAAAGLLRTNAAEHKALVEAMRRGASVAGCVQAIEAASAAAAAAATAGKGNN
ncbi:hypothetical protein VOLCADRAFT_105755 [Volvox carteri f. nagariensis]|uniref:Uncharacterized protein n=1 Tax=Volvox carteri f. nagariensis TaxID=3068 RepID=D8U2U7_VOLCA|nr:uncharacterized protein VOLCADRAFT_105755 [Volvox carteri f. nagariensis]EFJ45868.1 hypothetical protein VOLCADRAFT_105755 [Volvox carteri f. nagariensis]|eukprot:XP_002952946.1 hypothetical protein VOLCADRAFT_105755 [Volvox carteri f. nagariensis]